jgi:hypothetical protein
VAATGFAADTVIRSLRHKGLQRSSQTPAATIWGCLQQFCPVLARIVTGRWFFAALASAEIKHP